MAAPGGAGNSSLGTSGPLATSNYRKLPDRSRPNLALTPRIVAGRWSQKPSVASVQLIQQQVASWLGSNSVIRRPR